MMHPRTLVPADRRRFFLRAFARSIETLETRRHFCSEHDEALERALAEATARTAGAASTDHDAAWYAPATKMVAGPTTGRSAGSDMIPAGTTLTLNAAGLPLLNSRSDGQGLKVFLDFDGYGSDTPFSTDADGSTFNTSEQQIIYDTWRDIVSFFAPLNVNVTTVQPPIGGSNPVFVWQRISNSISGGAAYVGWLTNNSSNGWTGSENATGRHSGIAHEIGHQLGLSHQSEYDASGAKTEEYTDGFGSRDRAIIGIDFAENVRNWYYGRNSDSPLTLQDDLQVMANSVALRMGGDGYRPDAVGDTTAAATLVPTGGLVSGILERADDVDVYRFTSTGGTYQIAATPTFEAATSPKIELLDASGNLVAARDDADFRNTANNAQEFSLNLSSGTYYVRVISGGDYNEQGEYLLTAAPLPGGFTTVDVGATTIYRAGTAAYDPGTNTLTQVGGGTDIWSTADQFRFTSTTLTGNGSITARIDAIDNVDFHTKAGVMIRATTAQNSAHVYAGFKPGGQFDPIVRSSSPGSSSTIGNPAGVTGPWVRLTRSGNVFTIERSSNGTSWTPYTTTTVVMPESVQIGFATSARNARAQAYSTFSNITLTGALGTAAPTYNALPAPTDLTATPASGASTGINLAWSAVAGALGYAIERSSDGVTFSTLTTVGASVLSYANTGLFGSMRYFYRVAATGAGSTRSVPSAAVSAINKPSSPSNPNSSYMPAVIKYGSSGLLLNWTDVQGDNGYRIERSTAGGAFVQIATTTRNRNAYNDLNLSSGTAYSYRVTPITNVGDGVAPFWTISSGTLFVAPANFRVTGRTATSFTLAWTDVTGENGYRLEKSTDGTAWSAAGDILANVSSFDVTGLSPLTRYYFRLRVLDATNTPGAPSTAFAATLATTPLPTGWNGVDVGAVAGPGASGGTDGGPWTVIASGADIWNTADQFHFASRPLSGDGSIVARLTNLDNTDFYVKAGVMIRQSTAADSPYVFMHYSNGPGLQLELRDVTGNFSSNAFTLASTARWLKLSRTGNVFTASYSSDGTSWTVAGSRTIAMSTGVRMGLAATSHNIDRLTLATFDNVTTTGAGVNSAPTILVAAASSPAANDTATLSVTASDDGGAANLSYLWSVVSKPAGVADPTFTANGTNSARLSTAMFAAAGNYVLRVTVSDAQGLAVTSDVAVTVALTASAAFEWDAPQPRLVVHFNGDVDPTLSADDLVVTNVTTDTTLPSSAITRTFDAATNTAIFTFTARPDGTLPDGNYEATLAAGTVTEPSGVALAASLVTPFFVKAGDADHDRDVDFNDLVALAQNYGSTGKTFSQGNFDYDPEGRVDFADLVLLAQNYGSPLPANLASLLTPPGTFGATTIGTTTGKTKRPTKPDVGMIIRIARDVVR